MIKNTSRYALQRILCKRKRYLSHANVDVFILNNKKYCCNLALYSKSNFFLNKILLFFHAWQCLPRIIYLFVLGSFNMQYGSQAVGLEHYTLTNSCNVISKALSALKQAPTCANLIQVGYYKFFISDLCYFHRGRDI